MSIILIGMPSMLISQKCQYAVRAVFELGKHYGQSPVKIAAVAQAQAVPPRFLEVILAELKQAGFVESRRGAEGGYWLVRTPSGLSVEEVIRFVEGPIGPVACVLTDDEGNCPLRGECVFLSMWRKVQKATADIYRNTTFQDLLDDEDARRRGPYVPMYSI
jgi:Rrf2 family cysteine metabolism transcriptional repressor